MTSTWGSRTSKAELALREIGLGYPETTEDFPWGHRTLKVKGKAFIFMGTDEANEFGVSLKLPESADAALGLPFVEPTGYGLGKSGWVSAKFPADKEVPLGLLEQWMRESYIAVAPKRVAALLGTAAGSPRTASATKQPARTTSAAKQSARATSAAKRQRNSRGSSRATKSKP